MPEAKYRIGQTVEYQEDGGICECTLDAYSCDARWEKATLTITKVIKQPSLEGDYVVGDQFSVEHRIDVGVWGGDWHIRA
jgi:hypothetical protein